MKNLFTPILLSAVALFAVATASADESETLALREAVNQACPAFWEALDSEIDLSNQTGDFWENDTAGRDAFIAYLANAMSDSSPTMEALNIMADDRLTVATECATQRAALMQHQMETMPNDILISMNAVGAGIGEAIGSAKGFSSDNPGRDCKDIKERYPEAAMAFTGLIRIWGMRPIPWKCIAICRRTEAAGRLLDLVMVHLVEIFGTNRKIRMIIRQVALG